MTCTDQIESMEVQTSVRQTNKCIVLNEYLNSLSALWIKSSYRSVWVKLHNYTLLCAFLLSSHEESAQFLQSHGGRKSAHLQLLSRLQRRSRRFCAELLLWLMDSAEDWNRLSPVRMCHWQSVLAQVENQTWTRLDGVVTQTKNKQFSFAQLSFT